MNDFLKKLNVLVKASINEAVSGDNTAKRPRVSKMLDENVQTLRQRINEAVDYEDEMQARVRQFEDEAAGWDRQADEAVTRGDDTNARYAIEQMKRAEQRVALAQSDLREHQQATQELMQHVNVLEAAVADAARNQSEKSEAAPPKADVDTDTVETSPQLRDLGNILRDARDKITSLSETAAQREVPPTDSQENEAAVDNDLERRRERLSKR